MTPQELPWLPRPTPDDREALKSVTGQDGERDALRLMELVRRSWGEGELRSIGRRFQKALQAVDADWRAAAKRVKCTPFSLFVVSSGTFSHMVDALKASALRSGIALDCRVVEYQEPEAWLAANPQTLSGDPPDATLLALDRKTLQLKASAGQREEAEQAVADAIARYERIAGEVSRITGRMVIAQTLTTDASDPQLSTDRWLPGAPRQLIAAFNLSLTTAARQRSHAIFDAAAIAELVGTSQWDPGRYGFVAKLPFSPDFVPLYTYRLVQLLAAMTGKSRRVLVLDLDNTIWGGIVGDDGVEGLVLGAGNARGEAHLAIQRLAAAYKERGVILCVASKNTDSIARQAFRDHPEMLLREDDIALFQINWDDKASNIKAMSEALDLGLESFVFVDDNPVERKQVRDVLPGVSIPELPDDPSGWVPMIQAAAYFEQLSFSVEDQARTEYYKGNARRSVQAKSIGDHRKFLESLQMVMTVAPFDSVGRARIAQLISKSNQFNLTTRRYSENEVAALGAAPDVEAMQIRLKDMFGDNGMISVVICRKHASYWEVDTWIMSCRVLGRGVEQSVLNLLVERARAAGATALRGVYIPTAKNGLVRDHYAGLGFSPTGETADGTTTWSLRLDGFVPREVPIQCVERSEQ